MAMNEEANTERKEKTVADGNTQIGDQSSAYSIIEQANTAAERLERANKEKALLLAREEQLMARQALGGKSLPPQQPEPPKKLTPREYVAYMEKYGRVPPSELI